VPHPAGGGRGRVGVLPPLVGPITFHVGEEEIYWHTGDGGLYENQGFESLLFVFLKKLQDKTARRALIIAFDSSFPFAVGERRLSRRAQPFSLWNYDYTRIPGIMEQRASTYQALFFRSLQYQGVFPDNQTVRLFHPLPRSRHRHRSGRRRQGRGAEPTGDPDLPGRPHGGRGGAIRLI
jgi:hypothetical protein